MTNPEISTSPVQEFDEEDSALQASLLNMQAIVTQHLMKIGLPIGALTTEAQQAVVDKITPYLEFELTKAEGVWIGAHIISNGPGGIIVADSEGGVCGAQAANEHDVITGFVDDITALPVPSLESMQESNKTGECVSIIDPSLSAVIILKDADFSTVDDAGNTIEHDLSYWRVLLPLVYGMKTTMSNSV